MTESARLDPDGLRLLTETALSDLKQDSLITEFAGGLIPTALAYSDATNSLVNAIYDPDSNVYPFLTALLALDAELEGFLKGQKRVFPLPGFFSYKENLPPDKYPLKTLRLPPLNPDGHFFFKKTDAGHFLAIRLDLNPALKVLGHIRLAVCSPDRFPIRLRLIEDRMERQYLDEALLKIIGDLFGQVEVDPPLTNIEQKTLIQTLRQLIAE